jgi:hypothetical protein
MCSSWSHCACSQHGGLQVLKLLTVVAFGRRDRCVTTRVGGRWDRAGDRDARRSAEAPDSLSSPHGKTLRFSNLERAIPEVSQKMLAQQLRQMEQDRGDNPFVPPSINS